MKNFKVSKVPSGLMILAPVLFWTLGSPQLSAQKYDSVADAISGSFFFPQRVVWLGDQPPDEGESRLLWEILDAWRLSRKQLGLADMEMFLEALHELVVGTVAPRQPGQILL